MSSASTPRERFIPHFANAFARSLFTNSSLIFVNSIFVSRVGGKSYSLLFFFASLFSIFYYIFFSVAGERNAYRLYRVLIALTALISVTFFFRVDNTFLLYAFGVAIVIIDVIGTNLGPIVLQAAVNPMLFREIFQKMVTLELLARIAAASIVGLLSQYRLLGYYYVLGWPSLLAHFLLFYRLSHGLSVAEKIPRFTFSVARSFTNPIRFLASNALARLALLIMVWTHVTKFVVEYLFYQAVDSHFLSASEIASFVSGTTVTMILLSLLIQRLIGRRLGERLQLSALFSIQPTNIILLGGATFLMPAFWPLVLLMVSYQCINRSIQLPVSRQCLLPIPRSQRGAIVSMISLFMSVAALLTSGAMSSLRNIFTAQDFLVGLLVLAFCLFFLITRLDSYYIRNLWSFYRESREGQWIGDPGAETLTAAELEAESDLTLIGASPYVEEGTSMVLETHAEKSNLLSANAKANRILETYASAYGENVLAEASRAHAKMLASDGPALLAGLKIAFVTDFPWFENLFAKYEGHGDARVRHFVEEVAKVNSILTTADSRSATFRRKLKVLGIRLLEESSAPERLLKLKTLTKLPTPAVAEVLLDLLYDPDLFDIRETVFTCLGEDDKTFDPSPLVEQLFHLSYGESRNLRHAIQQLQRAGASLGLGGAIHASLGELRGNLQLSPSRKEEWTNRFLHTLFLDELSLSAYGITDRMMATIAEFPTLAPEDKSILVDMHLEYLKKSRFLSEWKAILANL